MDCLICFDSLLPWSGRANDFADAWFACRSGDLDAFCSSSRIHYPKGYRGLLFRDQLNVADPALHIQMDGDLGVYMRPVHPASAVLFQALGLDISDPARRIRDNADVRRKAHRCVAHATLNLNVVVALGISPQV